MIVAIDQTSMFAYVELHEKFTRDIARQFLKTLIEKVPYAIHTVLTDNGSQFTNPRKSKMSFKTPIFCKLMNFSSQI